MVKYETAEFEFAAGRLDQLPPSDVPEVVFSGKSNVGKSSLINKLLNRKGLARVSATPGKTGTINFYNLTGIRLVDLPGYGYAKVSQSEKRRWATLVEGYLQSDRNISMIVQIIDMRHAPTQDDIHMIQFLLDQELPFVIVATKSDKLKVTARRKQLEFLEDFLRDSEGEPIAELIPFSAQTGEGVDVLKGYLEEIDQAYVALGEEATKSEEG
ncbi:MAG: ribosome biogenesis GTP-binding protein YihA/YsxC [Oscillospiraceae bacterium]|nr:ribosome biogenesis GTP-binding protein YihA/YsxC [Oscillospiraceae bacterium]